MNKSLTLTTNEGTILQKQQATEMSQRIEIATIQFLLKNAAECIPLQQPLKLNWN